MFEQYKDLLLQAETIVHEQFDHDTLELDYVQVSGRAALSILKTGDYWVATAGDVAILKKIED